MPCFNDGGIYLKNKSKEQIVEILKGIDPDLLRSFFYRCDVDYIEFRKYVFFSKLDKYKEIRQSASSNNFYLQDKEFYDLMQNQDESLIDLRFSEGLKLVHIAALTDYYKSLSNEQLDEFDSYRRRDILKCRFDRIADDEKYYELSWLAVYNLAKFIVSLDKKNELKYLPEKIKFVESNVVKNDIFATYMSLCDESKIRNDYDDFILLMYTDWKVFDKKYMPPIRDPERLFDDDSWLNESEYSEPMQDKINSVGKMLLDFKKVKNDVAKSFKELKVLLYWIVGIFIAYKVIAWLFSVIAS